MTGALAAYGRAAACYEDEQRRDGAGAVAWRKPFDRLMALYQRQGKAHAALDAARRALALVQRRPPDAWWKRVERIAGDVGETVDREGWEAGFRTRMERVVDGLDGGRGWSGCGRWWGSWKEFRSSELGVGLCVTVT